jgi:NAD(P)H-hydrate epimerase
VIATFLAQGLDPFDAAVAGTYVHGLAGDISGDEGVIAGDVAENVAAALELL